MSGSVPRRGGRRVFSGCSKIPIYPSAADVGGARMRTRYWLRCQGCNRNSKVNWCFVFICVGRIPSWDRNAEESWTASGKIWVALIGRKDSALLFVSFCRRTDRREWNEACLFTRVRDGSDNFLESRQVSYSFRLLSLGLTGWIYPPFWLVLVAAWDAIICGGTRDR